MDFFSTISVAFCLWQYICFSPFSLENSKTSFISKKVRQIFSLTVISIQLLVMILCMVFVDQFVNIKRAKSIKVADTITMILVQLTALVIFYESYVKRSIQKEFLQKINSIDFILEFKSGIIFMYAKQKRTNDRRLLWWLLLSFSIFIINLVISYISFQILYRWWIMVYASFLICSLRCYQIITYVDIIRIRYCEINKYIKMLEIQANYHETINDDLQLTLTNECTIFQRTKSTCIFQQMINLRRVCRLLSEANRNINEMFQFSIPLIVVNDFIHIMVNSYWILRIIFSTKAPFQFLVPPMLWTVLNLKHIFLLSSVCYYTTIEVRGNTTIVVSNCHDNNKYFLVFYQNV